jgi:hypothetical protein
LKPKIESTINLLIFKVVSIFKVTTSPKIILIVYFFLLTTKELVLLLARLIDFVSKVTLKVYINNISTLAINKFSTKI